MPFVLSLRNGPLLPSARSLSSKIGVYKRAEIQPGLDRCSPTPPSPRSLTPTTHLHHLSPSRSPLSLSRLGSRKRKYEPIGSPRKPLPPASSRKEAGKKKRGFFHPFPHLPSQEGKMEKFFFTLASPSCPFGFACEILRLHRRV